MDVVWKTGMWRKEISEEIFVVVLLREYGDMSKSSRDGFVGKWLDLEYGFMVKVIGFVGGLKV